MKRSGGGFEQGLGWGGVGWVEVREDQRKRRSRHKETGGRGTKQSVKNNF